MVRVIMPGCQHRGMEYCSGELMRGFTAWSFVQHCRCFIFSRCFDFLQVHFSCILIFCRYLEFSGILICSGIYIFSGVLIFSGILIFCMYLDFFIRIVVIQVFWEYFWNALRRNEVPVAKILMLLIHHKRGIFTDTKVIKLIWKTWFSRLVNQNIPKSFIFKVEFSQFLFGTKKEYRFLASISITSQFPQTPVWTVTSKHLPIRWYPY